MPDVSHEVYIPIEDSAKKKGRMMVYQITYKKILPKNTEMQRKICKKEKSMVYFHCNFRLFRYFLSSKF
jgi:hypothetical protein